MKSSLPTSASTEPAKKTKLKQRPMYALVKQAPSVKAKAAVPSKLTEIKATAAAQKITIDKEKLKAAGLILKWYRRLHISPSPATETVEFESTATVGAIEAKEQREYEESSLQKNLNEKQEPEKIQRPQETSASTPSLESNPRAEISSQISDSKQQVQRIMQYLRSVDNEAQKSQLSLNMSPCVTVPSEQPASPSTSDTLSNTPFNRIPDIRKNMLGLQLELKEHEKTIHALRAEIKRVKEGSEEDRSQLQKEMKSKLALQRKEYESIVKRHLGMIDKILLEKEDLAKQCGTMTEEYKTLEKKLKDKIMLMEENHTREMKQKRELWEAAEKVKRDRWIQEKTKLIKDQTVKGLEPEIQRMVAQHKFQMKRLEEKYREDMIREREILMEQHRQEIETYRDRIAIERRKAAEEEREIARQKYEKNSERDEIEFQQQRRKMLASFEEQKDRLMTSMKDEKRMAEINWKKMLDDAKQQVETVKLQKQEIINEMQKVHQEEMVRLREKNSAEIVDAKNQVRAVFEQEFREKERQLREKLVKDRDQEIEMVIERLEQETYSNSSDLSRKHRQEFERLKHQHEKEIQQVFSKYVFASAQY